MTAGEVRRYRESRFRERGAVLGLARDAARESGPAPPRFELYDLTLETTGWSVGYIHQGQYVTAGSNPVLHQQLADQAARHPEAVRPPDVPMDQQGNGSVTPGPSPAIPAQRFAAIAFSPETQEYGYSWGAGDLPTAERLALEACKAPDATLVIWGVNSWIALALGAGGWGAAGGDTKMKAEQDALASCQRFAADPRVALSYFAPQGPPRVTYHFTGF